MVSRLFFSIFFGFKFTSKYWQMKETALSCALRADEPGGRFGGVWFNCFVVIGQCRCYHKSSLTKHLESRFSSFPSIWQVVHIHFKAEKQREQSRADLSDMAFILVSAGTLCHSAEIFITSVFSHEIFFHVWAAKCCHRELYLIKSCLNLTFYCPEHFENIVYVTLLFNVFVISIIFELLTLRKSRSLSQNVDQFLVLSTWPFVVRNDVCDIAVGGDFGTKFSFSWCCLKWLFKGFMLLYFRLCQSLWQWSFLHYGFCINSAPDAMCCTGAADCNYGLPSCIMHLICDIR